jgi:diacylglycerol kinase (ATP)
VGAAILLPIALFMPVCGVGKALMAGSLLLVLVVELLNSGIEAATDRVSLEDHQLAKRAKDLGSAAAALYKAIKRGTWRMIGGLC